MQRVCVILQVRITGDVEAPGVQATQGLQVGKRGKAGTTRFLVLRVRFGQAFGVSVVFVVSSCAETTESGFIVVLGFSALQIWL